MKIRQNLIDNLVNSELSREEIVTQLLEARHLSKKFSAESAWLDQLADMLRNGDGGDEQDRIYQEYEDEMADIKETYFEKE